LQSKAAQIFEIEKVEEDDITGVPDVVTLGTNDSP